MTKIHFLAFCLWLLAPTAQAQFYETIRSGRPGQSIGASTVGQYTFQVQSGADVFGYKQSATSTEVNGLLTNAGFRFGLTDLFEVGAFVEYRSEEVTQSKLTSQRFGVSNLSVGVRYQVLEGRGWSPGVGFQFRLRLPVANEHYRIDNVAPSFVFVTSQQFSRFTLITNLGGAWNGTEAIPSGTYTVNLSYAITSRFGTFVENYGSVTAGLFETRMDAGFAWLATDNLQLDVLAGWGDNHGLQDYFVSTGFSWRARKTQTNSHQ